MLSKLLLTNKTAFASVISSVKPSVALFHTTRLLKNDVRKQYSSDYYKDLKQDKPATSAAPYITVFKKDNRAFCLGITSALAFPVRYSCWLGD